MKNVKIFTPVLLILVSLAYADIVYEGKWGASGSGNGEFDAPAGIVIAPNGNVYVCESQNHRVQYFTSTGSYLGQWGSYGTGEGELSEPLGITMIPTSGRIYVADRYNHRVQYFTSTGSFLGKWGERGNGPGQFWYPYNIGYGALSGYIYVADTQNERVQYFTTAGSYLGEWDWGIPGSPRGVVGHPVSGEVYVGCSRNYVTNFTPTGSYIGQICWIRDSGHHGVTFTPNGATLFVASYLLDCCFYFTTSGSLLGSWGSTGTGNGQFRIPLGIAFSPDGNYVYVSEFSGDRVQYFSDTTVQIEPASLGRVKALFN